MHQLAPGTLDWWLGDIIADVAETFSVTATRPGSFPSARRDGFILRDNPVGFVMGVGRILRGLEPREEAEVLAVRAP
jgi:hypothetical protein